jgi:hypothetical protein
VEQAFEEIFTTPIELRHLGPEDLLEPRKQELLFELDSLMSTSLYHKVEDVRSRLFHLTEEYNDIVRPRLGPLADNPEWRRIWLLINAFEGDLVLLVEARAIRLGDAVRAATSSNVPEIRDLATQTTDELRRGSPAAARPTQQDAGPIRQPGIS